MRTGRISSRTSVTGSHAWIPIWRISADRRVFFRIVRRSSRREACPPAVLCGRVRAKPSIWVVKRAQRHGLVDTVSAASSKSSSQCMASARVSHRARLLGHVQATRGTACMRFGPARPRAATRSGSGPTRRPEHIAMTSPRCSKVRLENSIWQASGSHPGTRCDCDSADAWQRLRRRTSTDPSSSAPANDRRLPATPPRRRYRRANRPHAPSRPSCLHDAGHHRGARGVGKILSKA